MKILPVAEAFFSSLYLWETVQAQVLFFEREFHWKFEGELLWCLGAAQMLLDPWKIFPAGLSCLRRLLIWKKPCLGSRRCIYRRRLMLCPVFLHTADAALTLTRCRALVLTSLSSHQLWGAKAKPFSKCWSSGLLCEKKNRPWKDFIFNWNLRKLNTSEVCT